LRVRGKRSYNRVDSLAVAGVSAPWSVTASTFAFFFAENLLR